MYLLARRSQRPKVVGSARDLRWSACIPGARERAQAHPVPRAPRLEARETAGGRVRRRVRTGERAQAVQASHAGEAL